MKRSAVRTSPEELRILADAEVYGWECAILGFAAGGLWVAVSAQLTELWGLLVLVPLVFLLLLLMNFGVRVGAHALVRQYRRRRLLLARASRGPRMAAPYERMPPVATATCMNDSCAAQIGERHRRSCPSLPAGWFGNN